MKINWEREALEELLNLLVKNHAGYVKWSYAIDQFGINVKRESESTKILLEMLPNCDDYCDPPLDDRLVDKYVNSVLAIIEERYNKKEQ